MSAFRGIVKPSLYEVAFVVGGGFQQALSDSGLQTNDNREFTVLCEAASFPGESVSTQPNRIYGAVREHAYEKLFSGDLQLTFRMDPAMNLRKFFTNWQKIIHNPETGDFGYYDDYVSEIQIYQYTNEQAASNNFVGTELKNRKPVYGVRLEECFPKTLGPIEVGYEQQNTYMKQTVDFAFRRWLEIPNLGMN